MRTGISWVRDKRQALIGLRYRKHLIAVYHPWFMF